MRESHLVDGDRSMHIRLRHTPRGTHMRRATAWWLPGSDVHAWWAVLSRMNVADGSPVTTSELELYVVPKGTHDRSAAALIVLAPEGTLCLGDGLSSSVVEGSGALPLIRQGNVLVPSDATLDLEPTEAEWSRLFPLHLHLLHPRFGHVGFELTDKRRAADLLAPPALLTGTWRAARAGAAPPRSIGPVVAVVSRDDLRRFEKEGRESVGKEPLNKLSKKDRSLPPGLTRMPGRLVARATLFFTDRAPEGAQSETWVDGLARWAERIAERGPDWAARDREIERLLRLMRDDPDRGLRYALPIGSNPLETLGGPSGRGGDRLGERPTDFDLSNIGGRRGVDGWDIRDDARLQLDELYRSQAARDVAAGQHRRAAYIYAHLLHDLRAAATTLAAGGHYREAAALWNDRLNEPAEAAKCLENAGLFEEALAIHRERSDFAASAKLLERIGRDDDARVEWRRAVDDALSSNDLLRAAELLERRLGEIDEAAARLRASWPDGSRSADAIDAWFGLCDRHGRDAEMLGWIDEEQSRAREGQWSADFATQMAERSSTLKSDAARASLNDTLRCAVGSSLSAPREPSSNDIQALVGALRPLDRSDPVFGRDITRFQDEAVRLARIEERKRDAQRGPLKVRRHGRIRMVAQFRLPATPSGAIERFPIHGDASGLVIEHRHHGSVKRTRRGFDVPLQYERWAWSGVLECSSSRISISVPWDRSVVVPASDGQPDLLAVVGLGTGGLVVRPKFVRGSSMRLRTPAWLSDDTMDVMPAGAGEVWTASCDNNGEVVLRRHGTDGVILSEERIGSVGIGGAVRLGRIGRHTALFTSDGVICPGLVDTSKDPRASLGARASSGFDIRPSPLGTLGRSLCVTYEWIRVYFEDRAGVRDALISKEHHSKACFIRNGAIVVYAQGSIRAVRTQDQKVHPVAELALPPAHRGVLTGIVPGRAADEFAVVKQDGYVVIYRVVE